MDRSRPCPPVRKVEQFWNSNPLAASGIGARPGTEEFFQLYDKLRERNETPEFCRSFYRYSSYAHQKVLEVGCGNAYTLARYAKSGAEIFGVDLSPTAIRISKQRFRYEGLAGGFCVGNAEQLPFPAESFDCVCSMGVLHHVPSTERAVDEIHRILRPGGQLLVMVYHRDSFYYRVTFPIIRLLTGKPIQQIVNEVDGEGNPKGDVYSRSELRHLLHRFRNIRMDVGLLQPAMVLPRIGRKLPDGLFRPLAKWWGWFLYARAERPS